MLKAIKTEASSPKMRILQTACRWEISSNLEVLLCEYTWGGNYVENCYDLNVCPPSSYVEIPIPIDDGIKGGDCGRYLNHESGALIKGISVLIKEVPKQPPVPSTMLRHSKRTATTNQDKCFYQNMTVLVPCS